MYKNGYMYKNVCMYVCMCVCYVYYVVICVWTFTGALQEFAVEKEVISNVHGDLTLTFL